MHVYACAVHVGRALMVTWKRANVWMGMWRIGAVFAIHLLQEFQKSVFYDSIKYRVNGIGEVRVRNRENKTGRVLTCQSRLLYVLLSLYIWKFSMTKFKICMACISKYKGLCLHPLYQSYCYSHICIFLNKLFLNLFCHFLI